MCWYVVHSGTDVSLLVYSVQLFWALLKTKQGQCHDVILHAIQINPSYFRRCFYRDYFISLQALFPSHCQIFPTILLNCRRRSLFPLCRRPSSRPKMVLIGSNETPVLNYHSTVRKLLKSSDLIIRFVIPVVFVNKLDCSVCTVKHIFIWW